MSTSRNQQVPFAHPLSNRQSVAIDLVALTLLITLFYFIGLGSYPLFTPDEGRYAEVAREMLASNDFITPRVNGIAFLDKPILYYWLQAAAMATFGINEWAIRFFPALYGLIGCLVVYIAGRRLFNRATGLISAVILATTPLYFSLSHYANLDLEVAVLITISLLSFLMATHSAGKPRTALLLLAYFFAGLGFLTKGLIAIAFPMMIIGLWVMCLSRWRLLLNMYLGSGLIIIAAITLPWFVMVQQANSEFLHFFFVTQQVARFLSTTEFNNPTPIWFYIPIILIGFLPWGAFLLQALVKHAGACWRAREQQASVLFLLIWALIVFCFFSIPHSKTVSYILPIFPALALLTGKYLADGWQLLQLPTAVKIGMGGLVVVNLFLAAVLFALPPYQWIEIVNELTPTLLAVGSILALSAILIIFLFHRLRMPSLVYLCATTSLIALLTLTNGARYLNPNTAKPLAIALKSRLRPTDTVVNYFKFYQDLPIYLNRTLVLVADWQAPDIEQRDNWVRELWYSIPFQKTDHILLNETTFWQRWHSQENIYVFLNQNYLRQFQANAGRYDEVGHYRDIMVVTNHAPKDKN